ncbi:low molecular weight protein-tyrosine-phosphatase [Eggerthellaceae bacterium 24-137]
MPSSPIRILFVCHGNICRSTMAEFVLKGMVAARGQGARFHIESAATSTEEIGNPVHPGTQAVLSEHGIGGFENKRARQLRRADYDDFDLIIGMDEANMRNMGRMLGDDAEGKLHKLLEFAGSTRDVADPWYTGDFDTTYEDVCDGCIGLLTYLGM